MIIVYIILLFIAVLLFMLLLGFIDIVYNAAVCGIGIPVLILCLLFVIGMLIIG